MPVQNSKPSLNAMRQPSARFNDLYQSLQEKEAQLTALYNSIMQQRPRWNKSQEPTLNQRSRTLTRRGRLNEAIINRKTQKNNVLAN